MINENEFNEWLQHPVTAALRELMSKKRQEIKDAWEAGAITDWNEHAHILLNAANIGECKAYSFIQNITYEDYESEVVDDKHKA